MLVIQCLPFPVNDIAVTYFIRVCCYFVTIVAIDDWQLTITKPETVCAVRFYLVNNPENYDKQRNSSDEKKIDRQGK